MIFDGNLLSYLHDVLVDFKIKFLKVNGFSEQQIELMFEIYHDLKNVNKGDKKHLRKLSKLILNNKTLTEPKMRDLYYFFKQSEHKSYSFTVSELILLSDLTNAQKRVTTEYIVKGLPLQVIEVIVNPKRTVMNITADLERVWLFVTENKPLTPRLNNLLQPVKPYLFNL